MIPLIFPLGLAVRAGGDELRRLLREDDGQDFVEYAFLAVFIGVTSYLTLNGIVSAVGYTYAAWLNPTTGVPSQWEPAVPGGGS